MGEGWGACSTKIYGKKLAKESVLEIHNNKYDW